MIKLRPKSWTLWASNPGILNTGKIKNKQKKRLVKLKTKSPSETQTAFVFRNIKVVYYVIVLQNFNRVKVLLKQKKVNLNPL